ncbi:hypothetical protein ACIGT4_16055 [Streptomyces sioyaensis]|uniref:hypothetical protein n=1 Tax=Streptomyces sioyaensis TaxID=67364 RepID=UPI0037D48991
MLEFLNSVAIELENGNWIAIAVVSAASLATIVGLCGTVAASTPARRSAWLLGAVVVVPAIMSILLLRNPTVSHFWAWVETDFHYIIPLVVLLISALVIGACVVKSREAETEEGRIGWLVAIPFIIPVAIAFSGLALGLALVVAVMWVLGGTASAAAREELKTYRPGGINNPLHARIIHKK